MILFTLYIVSIKFLAINNYVYLKDKPEYSQDQLASSKTCVFVFSICECAFKYTKLNMLAKRYTGVRVSFEYNKSFKNISSVRSSFSWTIFEILISINAALECVTVFSRKCSEIMYLLYIFPSSAYKSM